MNARVLPREETMAFAVRDDDDVDHDGLPDSWERRVGTLLDVADGSSDPDGDGLTNLQEYRAGTLPLQADSDGGGETDGSEVLMGRDPTVSTDDGVQPHGFSVSAGNGRVFVRFDLPSSLMQFAFERVADASGASPVAVWRGEATPLAALEVAAGNGSEVCLRVRTIRDGAESSWAPVRCVTPKADPYAPMLSLDFVSTTHTRLVTLRLGATDDVSKQGAHAPQDVDTTASESGLAHMRISTSADFQGVSWVAFTPTAEVWIADTATSTYYVQVRDRAGNVSETKSTIVQRVNESALDNAIALEERALDALAAGDLTAARAAVSASIPKVSQAIDEVRHAGCSHGRWVLGAKLLGVKGRKVAALVLVRPATKAVAARML